MKLGLTVIFMLIRKVLSLFYRYSGYPHVGHLLLRRSHCGPPGCSYHVLSAANDRTYFLICITVIS